MLADDPTTAFLVMGGLLVALVIIVLALRQGTEAPRRRIDDEYLPQDRRSLGLDTPPPTLSPGSVMAPGLLGGSITNPETSDDATKRNL